MSESRGQLVLVAALGLAVVFVALALLLNTVIYAENLATRGADVGGGDAVAYQAAAESGAAGGVARANEYNYSGYDAAVRRVRADVARWSGDAGAYAALDSSAASATLVNVTNGTTIAQDEHGTFTNDDGDANWGVADGVTGVRRFEMNVTRSSLHARSGAFPDATTLLGSGSFRASVANASHSVDVAIFNDTASGDVTVQVVNASGSLAGTCSVDADNATVDLTEGRVGGSDCAALDVPGVEGSFGVSYQNADQVEGVYGLVVDEERADVVAALGTDPFASQGSGVPYAVPGVYDATLTVRVATPQLTYEGNVTAAPTDGVGGPGVNG
jgi:hypothetical protein